MDSAFRECCSAIDSIKKLKEINDLIDSQAITSNFASNEILYDGWKITTVYQAENNSITMGGCEILSNSKFPEHYHKNSVEIFIVKKGGLTVHFYDNDQEITVKAGDARNFIYIEPEREHSVTATEFPTHVFFVLVPSDEGFPNYDSK